MPQTRALMVFLDFRIPIILDEILLRQANMTNYHGPCTRTCYRQQIPK